ncbi:unnamed protein product [Merluccius merluccius]
MDPQTRPAAPPPLRPVYKERLQVKYLKTTRKKSSLDVRRWRFLNDILDDDDDDDDDDPTTDKVLKACFSRQNPTQQTRREHVAAVERKLLQHPLALYDHYEQNMPPEVPTPDRAYAELQDNVAQDDKYISEMRERFWAWDASLEEYSEMFAFQAFRKYLISNCLRVPEVRGNGIK